MDGIGPELKKRALQLYRHNLTGLLEGALRSSNAQFEGAEVLDRVSVRLLEANPGDTGWEGKKYKRVNVQGHCDVLFRGSSIRCYKVCVAFSITLSHVCFFVANFTLVEILQSSAWTTWWMRL